VTGERHTALLGNQWRVQRKRMQIPKQMQNIEKKSGEEKKK